MEDLLDDLDRWRRAELRVALARVVEIDGPTEPTASMAINERGEVAGSVSAACLQAAVVAAALEVLRHGRARLVSFGHSGDQAFSVGLAAGGTIHVLLEPLDW
ncbi:MAG TPA: XdhC family protein [Acidimicrobiales bacterium]|nr:XdhC family protein [Acidimicrobiales bacterium]